MDELPSDRTDAKDVREAFRLRLLSATADTDAGLKAEADAGLVPLLVMPLLVVLAVVVSAVVVAAVVVVPPKLVRATMVLIKSECTDKSLC